MDHKPHPPSSTNWNFFRGVNKRGNCPAKLIVCRYSVLLKIAKPYAPKADTCSLKPARYAKNGSRACPAAYPKKSNHCSNEIRVRGDVRAALESRMRASMP